MDSSTVENARSLGILSKINIYDDRRSYIDSWKNIIAHLMNVRDDIKLVMHSRPICDVDDIINVHEYSNKKDLWDKFVRNLHEKSDVSGFIKDLVQARGTLCKEKACEKETPVLLNSSRGVDFKGTAHIISVDWEDTVKGASAFIYARDVYDRSTTYLITKPLRDYFYVQIRDGVESTTGVHKYPSSKEVLNAINRQLWNYPQNFSSHNYRAKEAATRRGGHILADTDEKLVLAHEIVRDHKSVYGFQRSCGKFIKIYTLSPTVTKLLFLGLSKKNKHWLFFEANLCPVSKFMVSHDLATGAVVEFVGTKLPANLMSCTATYHVSSCIVMKRISRPDLPLYIPRMMYYDIECLTHDVNVFPQADSCPVIQISFVITDGTKDVIRQGVLCLNETVGSDDYISFDREDQMLIAFAKLVREYSIEFMIGYNSNSFDMPYILDRMDVLNISFAKALTWRRGLKLSYDRVSRSSNQSGERIINIYQSPGLTMLDMLEVLKGDVTLRLRSYSLKAVCSHFLQDDNKEDLRYRDIPDLFKSPSGRGTIAKYCLKDSVLLLSIDRVASIVVKTLGMASVLGTNVSVVLDKGLVFKLISKIQYYTRSAKFLIPSFTNEQKPTFEGSYDGAFVLDPIVGYHKDPVVVCDAASLYPSVMRCDNLSWDTFCIDKEDLRMHPGDYKLIDQEYFVDKRLHTGIFVKMQTDLARERTEAKKSRDNFTSGSDEYNVYESIQLGTKVVMNSLYGMLGSKTATVPLVQLARTITGRGRFMLQMFKEFVEKRYTEITNERLQAIVIYGDTDSIFFKLPGVSIEQAISYGHLIEEKFRAECLVGYEPHNFEYEKTFYPFMISQKKNYIGALYENDPTKCKLKAMGIRYIRRDTALLCTRVMKGFFEKFIIDHDPDAAYKHVQSTMQDLFAGNIPLDEFGITKKINKIDGVGNRNPGAHISCWKRMVNRLGPSECPVLGERFEFVVLRKEHKRTDVEHAMIDMVLAKSMPSVPLDYRYYTTTFIDRPMRTYLEYAYGKKETEKLLRPSSYNETSIASAKPGDMLSYMGCKTYVQNKRIRSEEGPDISAKYSTRQVSLSLDGKVLKDTAPETKRKKQKSSNAPKQTNDGAPRKNELISSFFVKKK